MFEVLFIYPKVLARHQSGPAALDRERYLAHCAGQGAAHGTLLRIARELLVIAERIDVTVGKSVTRSEIDAAARAWARQQKRRCRAGSEQWSRHLFAQVAAAWLRFLGILEDPPHSERNAFFSRDVDEFIAHLRTSVVCLRIRSAAGGGRSKASWTTSLRAKPRLHRSPSLTSTPFSNRKVGRIGVAYLSRRVQRRCARSSGMPRNDGGALRESQRPSTRHACSNRKGSPEVLVGPTSSGSSTAPADANRAMYATAQF